MKNDLLLRVLRGEQTERPPVWMMRQAGRYLPEYIELRNKYSFFERCQTPELATEITLQPIDLIGVDAAILFSDILVVPQAMNLEVLLKEGIGPVLPDPISSVKDIERLIIPDVNESLGYVFEAIKLTKKELNDRVPLIGFAGSPWTIFCYMVQGRGSKNFEKAKAFCYTEPVAAKQVLQMITDTTIAYLKEKVKAGVDVIQLFDSWGGILSPADFREFSLPYSSQIISALKEEVLTILFAKGAWYALKDMAQTGAHGLGLDWCTDPAFARSQVGPDMVLQGNFDPSRLTAPIPVIVEETKKMIRSFGSRAHIANLGHGILPMIKPDHAKAFVDTVKSYSYTD